MGSWWLAASSRQCARSCITSWAEFFGKTSNHPGDSPFYSPDLVPSDFWLFPKLKFPSKGKRFQTIDEIQEDMMGQLMATGRTVWGPKVPTLKGTEASLFHVQCFLYLVSSTNVSIFHITWLDTFWTDLIEGNTHRFWGLKQGYLWGGDGAFFSLTHLVRHVTGCTRKVRSGRDSKSLGLYLKPFWFFWKSTQLFGECRKLLPGNTLLAAKRANMYQCCMFL